MKLIYNMTFLDMMIAILIIHYPPKNNGQFPEENQNNIPQASTNIERNKIIEKFALSELEKIRIQLENTEPIIFILNQTFHFTEADFWGDVFVGNVTFPDLSQLTVKNLTSYAENKTLFFDLFWKKFTITHIQYDLTGESYIFPVEGSGEMNTVATKVEVTGLVHYDYNVKNDYLGIEKIDLGYSFDNLEVTVTGMKVPFTSQAELNKLLSTKMANRLRKNEKEFCAKISKITIAMINSQLKQTTIANIFKQIQNSSES